MSREKYPVFARLVVFGVFSFSLYGLLYFFADDVIAASDRVRGGEKLYAGIPIGIAFLFSFAHGKFTSYFWDCLGCQAKHKK